MIQSFADEETRLFFETGKTKKIPPTITKHALRKLEYVDNAVLVTGLRLPPRNHLHALKGDQEGQYAILINDQWRITFRFTSEGAFNVEICDYH